MNSSKVILITEDEGRFFRHISMHVSWNDETISVIVCSLLIVVIIVILKHHCVGKGLVFISASTWKNSTDTTICDVGMLLSPLAHKALMNIEETRIIIGSPIMTITGNPIMTIICFLPTSSSDEEKVTYFSLLSL